VAARQQLGVLAVLSQQADGLADRAGSLVLERRWNHDSRS
jgi:hypothetical protein